MFGFFRWVNSLSLSLEALLSAPVLLIYCPCFCTKEKILNKALNYNFSETIDFEFLFRVLNIFFIINIHLYFRLQISPSFVWFCSIQSKWAMWRIIIENDRRTNSKLVQCVLNFSKWNSLCDCELDIVFAEIHWQKTPPKQEIRNVHVRVKKILLHRFQAEIGVEETAFWHLHSIWSRPLIWDHQKVAKFHSEWILSCVCEFKCKNHFRVLFSLCKKQKV